MPTRTTRAQTLKPRRKQAQRGGRRERPKRRICFRTQRQIAPTRRDLCRAAIAQPADQLNLPTLRGPSEHDQLDTPKLAGSVDQTHPLRQQLDEMSSTTPALPRSRRSTERARC